MAGRAGRWGRGGCCWGWGGRRGSPGGGSGRRGGGPWGGRPARGGVRLGGGGPGGGGGGRGGRGGGGGGGTRLLRPSCSRSSRPWWARFTALRSRAPRPTSRRAVAWRRGRWCASSK